jgi:hypothetical protein
VLRIELLHRAVISALNEIPEILIPPGNNLYIAATRCTNNRKEFKNISPNQRYLYLKYHCMNFVPTNVSNLNMP